MKGEKIKTNRKLLIAIFVIVIFFVLVLILIRIKFGSAICLRKHVPDYSTVIRGNDVLGYIDVPAEYDNYRNPEEDFTGMLDYDYCDNFRGNSVTHNVYDKALVVDILTASNSLVKRFENESVPVKLEKATFGKNTGYLVTADAGTVTFREFMFEDEHSNIQQIIVKDDGSFGDVYKLVFPSFSFKADNPVLVGKDVPKVEEEKPVTIGNDIFGYFDTKYTDIVEMDEFESCLDYEPSEQVCYIKKDQPYEFQVIMSKYDNINVSIEEMAEKLRKKKEDEWLSGVNAEGTQEKDKEVGSGIYADYSNEVTLQDENLGGHSCKKLTANRVITYKKSKYLTCNDYFFFEKEGSVIVFEITYEYGGKNSINKMYTTFHH